MIKLLITHAEIVAEPHGLPEVCICHYEANVAGHKLRVTQHPVNLWLVLNYNRPFVPNTYDVHYMGKSIKGFVGSCHDRGDLIKELCLNILRERFDADS